MSEAAAVQVVGIGDDGWAGLPERFRELVQQADLVVGGPRHLAMIPGEIGAERQPWPSPLSDGLPRLITSWSGRRVVVLASGDPFVAGIGRVLVELIGAERVVVHPGVSSVALARARMGWDASATTVLRDHLELPRFLADGHRIIVLSADETIPAEVASLLVRHGAGGSSVTALAHLGGAAEQRFEAIAAEWGADEWGQREVPSLHVLAIEVLTASDTPALGWVPGLPDDAFEHDGQLTKRDLRASALARLAPGPGQLLWDVGAGAGSIGIEWMRAHPTCRALAVEADPERSARIGRNALALGVPRLDVVQGRAPDALADLPRPHAVFIGGGATRPGVIEAAWNALVVGGRLVVHAVTWETERVVVDWAARLGGEMTRISVETAGSIGSFTGWNPARAVVQWSVRKQEES